MAVNCLLWLIQQEGVLVCAREGVPRWQFKCYLCGEPILPEHDIQFDHIHADVHGGPHEYQNLRPIHYDPCHKKKSAKDVAANAKIKRIRAGGRKKRGPRLQSRGFQQASRPFPKRRKPSAS